MTTGKRFCILLIEESGRFQEKQKLKTHREHLKEHKQIIKTMKIYFWDISLSEMKVRKTKADESVYAA